MDTSRKLTRRDALAVAGLLACTALYAATCLTWSLHPFEDAAILMRYAQHLSQGHGVVWNVGEPPVDGATDFLFMVAVAGLARAGLSVEAAVRALAVLCHFLSVALVYLGVRRLHGSGRWLAAFSAAYLAVGPGLRFAAAYFGTPCFALFVLITWWLAQALAEGRGTWATPAGFAVAGLTMGLIRPEGVFLALFLLAAIVRRGGPRRARAAVWWMAAVFVLIGGAYFLWRWRYFGYPLPNPYYKKGGGLLYWSGLIWGVKVAAKSALPFALAYLAALRSGRTLRLAGFSLIPIGLFVALWLLLSPEGNYFGRFQYPVVPLVLLAWPPLVSGIGQEWGLPRLADLGRRSRATAIVLLAAVGVGILVYHHRLSRMPIRARDGRYQVAVLLADYRGRGYTLATSEAGLLPFYSGWRAIDTWGLNDPWIAHHAGITQDYLRLHRPDVIMFHAYFSPLASEGRRDEWHAMAMTLKGYAEANGYVHAAAFGETPYDTHHYYVRSGFPDSEAIVHRIRATDYTWMSSGRTCVNFALLRRAPQP